MNKKLEHLIIKGVLGLPEKKCMDIDKFINKYVALYEGIIISSHEDPNKALDMAKKKGYDDLTLLYVENPNIDKIYSH